MCVTSTLMMSPSLARGPGMPWHTTSLIDVQTLFGNGVSLGRAVQLSGAGRAPFFTVSSWTNLLISSVVIPV